MLDHGPAGSQVQAIQIAGGVIGALVCAEQFRPFENTSIGKTVCA
jgi:hypothetical protein